MWYHSGWFDGTGLAVSSDGINWNRVSDSILPHEPGWMRDGDAVWLDEDSADPDRRYKMMVFYRIFDEDPRYYPFMPRHYHDVPGSVPPREVTRLYASPDGLNWTLIGEVKNNPRMHIPIIGNGDISTAQRAKEMFDRYGVDGIMVGRASFGHPWIFTEIRHLLDTGEEMPPMNVRDRVALAKRHFGLSMDLKGPVTGVFEMRRHLSCYFKGLPGFKETRIKLVTSKDPDEILRTLDYVAERWGDAAPESENVYGL